MSVGAQGRLRTCCHQSTPPSETTLGSIVDFKALGHNQDIRLEMKQGRVPQACSGCLRLEEQGGDSPRLEYLSRFGSEDLEQIKYLDLTVDNVCNLECLMCTPLYSSRLNSSFSEIYPNHKTVSAWKLSTADLTKVFEQLPFLEMLTITGGEPFHSPTVQKILTHLIETGLAARLSLRIFSNFTVRPSWMVKTLSAFNECEILASIDAIDEAYERIRYPAKWTSVIGNLNWLLENRSANISIRVHAVAMAPGWRSLGGLLRLTARISGLSSRIPSVTLLSAPVHLQPDVLSEAEYQEGCNSIESALAAFDSFSEEEAIFAQTWRALLAPQDQEIFRNHALAYQIYMRKRLQRHG
jgi:hypothetical protein